ncbi:MAG: Hsp33 family molecular chaperone HslO [Opitutae bacterium]|nr:Hsp33 family molecular chaperone HslO [Opitutae bacterium]
MSEPTPEPVNGAEITTDFVRHRNVLLVRGDLSPLFVDYYLHLADNHLKPAPEHDRLFKQALAAFALHCASRPRFEHLAWTISLQDPRLNLFFAGDNEDCTVTGRIFTENVREAAKNVFYSDLMPRRGAEKRRSVVNFDGTDLFRAVEHYYATSEQRPARFFDLGDDRFAMLVSHPDCDERWLRGVDLAGVKEVAEKETVAPIERRAYRWNCGCTQQKIMGALAPAARDDLDGLFGEQESIHLQCPRCAAEHIITREAMEAFLAQAKK